MSLYYALFKTQIGWCGIVKGDRGVRRIIIGYRNRNLLRMAIYKLFPESKLNNPQLSQEIESLDNYIKAGGGNIEMALDFSVCTPFEIRVYQTLSQVESGRVVTYRELARMCGNPRAVRAVARALAKNPFPLVIPCHRVIRSNGGLGGFSAPGGVRLKKKLLEMERDCPLHS